MLAENALTTVANVKKYLDVEDGDDSTDEQVEFWINVASGIIEKFCERSFRLQVYNEYKQGRGMSKITVNNYPITNLIAVEVNEKETPLDRVQLFEKEGMIYLKDLSSFPLAMRPHGIFNPMPDDIFFNVRITYESGYILPKDATEEQPRTLPYDIEMACLRMISIMRKDNDLASGRNLILKREQLGDWIGEYEPEVPNNNTKLDYMDLDIMATLAGYKKSVYYV